MRGDYLERWRPLFGPNGFARLQRDGAWFTHCHYPYGVTTTGPGHASMLTGACPDKHGIVNNDWIEDNQRDAARALRRSFRRSFRRATRRDTSSYRRLPVFPLEPGEKKCGGAEAGRHPRRLLSETVADVLKAFMVRRRRCSACRSRTAPRSCQLASGPTARIGSTAFSALRRTTRTACTRGWRRLTYRRTPTSGSAKNWTALPPGAGLHTMERTGRCARRGRRHRTGRTFPHPTTGGKPTLGPRYYEALANSPYGNDLLLDFAKTCIDAEQLGADDTPDLLVISFSSNDLIGHTWGPDSHEVLDVTLRSDALMADLLAFLERSRRERSVSSRPDCRSRRLPAAGSHVQEGSPRRAGRPREVARCDREALTATFPTPKPADSKAARWVEKLIFPWIYLNPAPRAGERSIEGRNCRRSNKVSSGVPTT